MSKSNLPVILLKNLVLFPLGDARIELNNNITKKIMDISRDYFDNKVFDSVIQMQILNNKRNCENAIKQLKKEVYNLQKEKMNLMNE